MPFICSVFNALFAIEYLLLIFIYFVYFVLHSDSYFFLYLFNCIFRPCCFLGACRPGALLMALGQLHKLLVINYLYTLYYYVMPYGGFGLHLFILLFYYLLIIVFIFLQIFDSCFSQSKTHLFNIKGLGVCFVS